MCVHFIRDKITSVLVKIEKIHIEKNPTDLLIKSLPSIKFKHYLDLVGVRTDWITSTKVKITRRKEIYELR